MRKIPHFETIEDRQQALMSLYTETPLAPIMDRRVLEWLIGAGFCSAPASTKYHGAYPGGLFDHSMEVTAQLLDLTDKLGLKWMNANSPYVVGILHDICKLDQYVLIADAWDADGVTTSSHYGYAKDMLITGHGTKSAIIALQHMQLDPEQIACIVYHMGAYETSQWKEYDVAIKQYPNVLYTHTADMIASKLSEV